MSHAPIFGFNSRERLLASRLSATCRLPRRRDDDVFLLGRGTKAERDGFSPRVLPSATEESDPIIVAQNRANQIFIFPMRVRARPHRESYFDIYVESYVGRDNEL